MNDQWRSFLLEQGAEIDTAGNVLFQQNSGNPADFICALSRFNVIRISGTDATDFLHGQFTADLQALLPGQGVFTAWCNAKGRVTATFMLYRVDSSVWLLVLPEALTAPVSQRLRMFILRAKVQLQSLTPEMPLLGISANRYPAPLDFLNASGGTGQFLISVHENCIAMRMPGNRALILADTEATQNLWRELSLALTPCNSTVWQRMDIRAGLAWIVNATSEQFLPQELRLDETPGLSYGKGCYPGQEIIARVRYRGQVKRRLAGLTLTGGKLPEPGVTLRLQQEDKPVGSVIDAVPTANGESELLAVLGSEYLQQDTLPLAGYESVSVATGFLSG